MGQGKGGDPPGQGFGDGAPPKHAAGVLLPGVGDDVEEPSQLFIGGGGGDVEARLRVGEGHHGEAGGVAHRERVCVGGRVHPVASHRMRCCPAWVGV